MKKSILIAVVCLLVNYFVSAQNTHAKTQSSQVKFGIKAGVNIANIAVEGDDDNENNSRIGFHVGGLAHIHLSDHFAVQPELMYSLQGAESSTSKYKENYINVPVLLQYMTNNGFRLQTGPQVGFLVSAKQEIDNVGELDFKHLLNKVDFSWSFGSSYVSQIGLGLDIRYNLGISNRTKNENSPESRNRVWQIGAFYQF